MLRERASRAHQVLHAAAVASIVGQAEAALQGVVGWANWRLLGWVGAAVASRLASMLVLWWDGGAIAAARVEKRQLQAEVVEMQASRDEWVRAGLLGKLERCGLRGRPCVRVDERAGAFGERADYRVLLRY